MLPRCRHLFRALSLLVFCAAAIAQDTAPPPKFQVPADKLAAFVGQYVIDDDPDLVHSISLEGSRVFMESFRTRKVELLPQSEDTFATFNATVKFKFLRSTEGKVMGFNRIVEEGSDRHTPAGSSKHAIRTRPMPLIPASRSSLPAATSLFSRIFAAVTSQRALS